MKVCGIISEYNPFHYGHEYHLNQSKKITQADLIISVMSGNFVQRGEPAIINKWERAKVAVEQGCDIVFELPFIYATQSAQYFAKGAIDCLKLAKVDYLCFGSESNDLEQIEAQAKQEINLKEAMQGGLSCVKAHENRLGKTFANDILAVNYLKALKGSSIVPYTIQRTNAYHETELNHQYSSATAIRLAIREKSDVTQATRMKIDHPVYLEALYPTIQFLLNTLPKSTLSSLFMMDEGIENALIKHSRLSNYEDFINACLSKRYTRSKIQRTLIHLLNHTTKETVNHLPEINYLRVLAFNEKGKQYLNQLKKEVNIASKFNQIPEPYQSMEMKAIHVYATFYSEKMHTSIIETELNPPCFI